MPDLEYYARKHGDIFIRIEPNMVRIAMSGEGPYYKVILREANQSEISPYWAWQFTGKNRFSFPQPSRSQIEMCFPYGTKPEIEKGRGRLVNIIVKEIEKIEK